MIGYPEAYKAWWLTRGMARISGVNLSRAVVEGWLQRAELDGLVDPLRHLQDGKAMRKLAGVLGCGADHAGLLPEQAGHRGAGRLKFPLRGGTSFSLGPARDCGA